jgi:superfamily I DNA/RNA helicase
MSAVAKLLDPKFNAAQMRSQDVDLGHLGVKIMTMHAAKGLEFPVVAVLSTNAARRATDKRLFFVACSRAMRQLIVFAHRDITVPWLTQTSGRHWRMENL